MDTYERLLALTRVDYGAHILENPLLQRLGGAQPIAVRLYAGYLTQTYHLVRHTSRALALAAAHLDDDRRRLRAWFLEQAREEHGHEQFCLRDLRALGLDAEALTRTLPGGGAWGLITQNYYLATQGDPVGILGVASATEGMGAELAGGFAQQLAQRHGIPLRALGFLRAHAGVDGTHVAQVRDAVLAHVRCEQSFAIVLHARRMTHRYYGQLFRDVMSCEDLQGATLGARA